MSTERKKVLEMLASGKITAEEAEKILDRLAAREGRENEPETRAADEAGAGNGDGKKRSPRYLRVVVDSPERDRVNIRLPLGLVRTGLKLPILLPSRVGRRLSERGIDLGYLGKLNDEELIAELTALQIEIEEDGGEKVRIFCD